MTRNGKIARLPRHIRDELNRRLDNAEQGIQLVEWLNSLPEVKQVLETQFGGRPINEVNLTEWKNGGFLEWQGQQETAALLEDLKSGVDPTAKISPGELTEPLATAVVAHYAATLSRSHVDASDELRQRLRSLSRSLRDVVRLRRSELARQQTQFGQQRLEIERQWLELERQKTDDGQRKKFLELANDAGIHERLTPKMTPEEKALAIKKRFFPDDWEDESPSNGSDEIKPT